MPLKAEIAKSSRVKCTYCKEKIKRNGIKIGIANCVSSSWHHPSCFAKGADRRYIAQGIKPESFIGWNRIPITYQKRINSAFEEYWKKMAKLSMSKSISKMKVKELKHELKNSRFGNDWKEK